MPHANSTTSMPRVTSPSASASTLPCSAVISAARSRFRVLEQLAEREQHAGPAVQRDRTPLVGGRPCAAHDGVDVGGRRERDPAGHRAGGRVRDVGETPRRTVPRLPVDPVDDLGDRHRCPFRLGRFPILAAIIGSLAATTRRIVIDDATLTRRARTLATTLEPCIGQVYFSPECHAAYEALGFGASPARPTASRCPTDPRTSPAAARSWGRWHRRWSRLPSRSSTPRSSSRACSTAGDSPTRRRSSPPAADGAVAQLRRMLGEQPGRVSTALRSS